MNGAKYVVLIYIYDRKYKSTDEDSSKQRNVSSFKFAGSDNTSKAKLLKHCPTQSGKGFLLKRWISSTCGINCHLKGGKKSAKKRIYCKKRCFAGSYLQ